MHPAVSNGITARTGMPKAEAMASMNEKYGRPGKQLPSIRLQVPRYHRGIKGSTTGVFLMDSFGYALDSSNEWYEYLPDALQHVYMVTGMKTCALVIPGCGMSAAFRFMSVLNSMGLTRLVFIVFMFMGNDVYKTKIDVTVRKQFLDAVMIAKTYAENVHLVFGGSCELWQYNRSYLDYDDRVNEVCRMMKQHLETIKGNKIWAGIKVADKLGHVTKDSYETLAKGYVWVAIWASALTPRARL